MSELTSIENSLNRLHSDITALRAELAARDATLNAVISSKADLALTTDRLNALEEENRNLYRTAIKIAIAAGISGGIIPQLGKYLLGI